MRPNHARITFRVLQICKIIVLAAALAAAFPYYFTLAFSFPLFSSQGTGSFPFEKALGLPPRKAFLAASRFLPRPLVPVSGLRSPRRTPAQPVGSMFCRISAALVGSSGLEPPTSRLSGVRSNHLSYEPMSSSAALASAGRPAARPFPFCTLGPSASSRPRSRFTFPASCLQCNWWRISTWWR